MNRRALLLALLITFCGLVFGACGANNPLGSKLENVNITVTMDNVFESMSGNLKFAMKLPNRAIRAKVTSGALATEPTFYVVVEKAITANGNPARAWVATVFMKIDTANGLAYGSTNIVEEAGTTLFIRAYYYETEKEGSMSSKEISINFEAGRIYNVTLDFNKSSSSDFIFEVILPEPIVSPDTIRVGDGGGGAKTGSLSVTLDSNNPPYLLVSCCRKRLISHGRLLLCL